MQGKSNGQYSDLISSLAKKSSIVFVGRVVFFITGLASSILLARILGPGSLGQYRIGLTIIQISSIFAVVGLDRGLVRYFPILKEKNPFEAISLIKSALILSISISLAISLLLFFFSYEISVGYFHSVELDNVIKVFSFYLPLYTLLTISIGGTIGLKRADVSSTITNIFSPIIFIVLLVFAYTFNMGIYYCITIKILADFFSVLLLLRFICLNLSPSQTDSTKNQLIGFKKFISFSIPLMFIKIIYYLLGHMDIIMLGYFVNETEIGIYSIALSISTLIIFGTEIILPVIRPYFSELHENNDNQAIVKIFKSSSKWLLYSGTFVLGIIFILRRELLEIYGKEFLSASFILIILGIGYLSNVSTGPNGQLLVMTGRQKWEVINSSLMVIVNFILNLILIPKWGIVGAAFATASSYFLINMAKLIEVYIFYGIHPYTMSLLRGIFCLTIGFISCLLLHKYVLESTGFFTTIVTSTIVYCILILSLFFLFGFDEEDRMLFKQLLTGKLNR